MEPHELRSILRELFPDSEVPELDTPPEGGRLSGTLVWDGFGEERQIDRQHLLWSRLRNRLTPDRLRNVGLILTFTSDEMAAMAED